MLRFLALVFIMFVMGADNNAWSGATNELTDQERTELQEYVKEIPIEQGVGQLFIVGPSGDIMQQRDERMIDSLSRIGVGGIILNTYHFGHFDNSIDKETRNAIISYVNTMQRFAGHSSLKWPLLVAADFEGHRFSSFDGLDEIPHLPSMLSIGNTRNPEMIRDSGRLTGYVLHRLGFNMLLGPVVDVETSVQGTKRPMLGVRSISGDPNLVISYSSHFIRGIQEAGVISIEKHFPGLGVVDADPHKPMTSSLKSDPMSFIDQLRTFRAFAPYLDGVMTSHVIARPFDSTAPVTLDKFVVGSLLRSTDPIDIGAAKVPGLGLRESLIVTDDISDMGALLEYKRKNDLSWPDIIEASFKAGHDLILVSHIEPSAKPRNPRSKNKAFTYDDLVASVSHMTNIIKKSPALEKQLRDSLYRIALAKLKIIKRSNIKTWGTSARTMLATNMQSALELAGDDSFESPPFLKSKYKDNHDFLSTIIAESMLHINGKEFSQAEFHSSRNHCFVVHEEYRSDYEREFAGKMIIGLPREYKGSFESKKAEVVRASERCDLIFMHISRLEEVHIFEMLHRRGYGDKTIGLLHQSPKVIPNEITLDARLYGTMTFHPLSYKEADIALINGNLMAGPPSRLTVEYGPRKIVKGESVILPEGFESILDFLPSDTRKITELETKIKQASQDAERASNKLSSMKSIISAAYMRFHSKNSTVYLTDVVPDQTQQSGVANFISKIYDTRVIEKVTQIISDNVITQEEIIQNRDADVTEALLLYIISVEHRFGGAIEQEKILLFGGIVISIVGIIISLSGFLIGFSRINLSKGDMTIGGIIANGARPFSIGLVVFLIGILLVIYWVFSYHPKFIDKQFQVTDIGAASNPTITLLAAAERCDA